MALWASFSYLLAILRSSIPTTEKGGEHPTQPCRRPSIRRSPRDIGIPVIAKIHQGTHLLIAVESIRITVQYSHFLVEVGLSGWSRASPARGRRSPISNIWSRGKSWSRTRGVPTMENGDEVIEDRGVERIAGPSRTCGGENEHEPFLCPQNTPSSALSTEIFLSHSPMLQG